MYVGAGESRRTVGQIFQKCKETLKFWLNSSFVFILFCLNSSHILYNSKAQNQICTVKLRAVDRYTIQFWNFLAKGHYTSIKFALHEPSKIWKCATNRGRLLLVTLRYVSETKNISVLFHKNVKSSFLHDSHIWLSGFFTLLVALAHGASPQTARL